MSTSASAAQCASTWCPRWTACGSQAACAPDAVEDHIWDHHTLFESGFTPVPDDDRTPGEFLVGELSFADTVLLSDPGTGVQLIQGLAPHAVVT